MSNIWKGAQLKLWCAVSPWFLWQTTFLFSEISEQNATTLSVVSVTKHFVLSVSQQSKTMLKQLAPSHLHIDLILMIWGHTELIIFASQAQFCEESFGEVRFYVAPHKPNVEKHAFEAKQIEHGKSWASTKWKFGNCRKRVLAKLKQSFLSQKPRVTYYFSLWRRTRESRLPSTLDLVKRSILSLLHGAPPSGTNMKFKCFQNNWLICPWFLC